MLTVVVCDANVLQFGSLITYGLGHINGSLHSYQVIRTFLARQLP